MKILIIGGTGIISSAVVKSLCERGDTVYLLNRGKRGKRGGGAPDGVVNLTADINDESQVAALVKGLEFDAVADFIAYVPPDVERDFRLFRERTRQYIFISSASAYQKPLSDFRITESTPLANPHWEYSRNKIACEERLMRYYREEGFPITIVRPSHTYGIDHIPVGVHGHKGSWQVVARMLAGKPVIIHGDGSSLWTMTHNGDFAKGFVGLPGNARAIGEAVHITSDETLSWEQIYGIIARALGVTLKAAHVASDFLCACGSYDFRGGLLGDKAVSVVFDNSKIKRLVPGFIATKRFDQGIAETVEYILSHPECQTPDAEFDRWCDAVIGANAAAAATVKRESRSGAFS